MTFPKRQRIVDPELLTVVRGLPCLACGKTPSDPDHVTTRGAGGDDVATNVMPLCRAHHVMRHKRGIGYMARVFPAYRYWLEAAGRTDILERVGL